jgi:hypothetical protein
VLTYFSVSDVFHTGSPDSPLWEFKHGNGSFKRGDLVGLREIKRRASRHALIHRDSFSTGPKVPAGPPAGPPVEPMPDPVETRLNALEHSLYDMHTRMQRSEDGCAYLNQKNQVLMEGLMRCHQVGPAVSRPDLQWLIRKQWNHDLTTLIMALVPDPENQIHKDGKDLARPYSHDDWSNTYGSMPHATGYCKADRNAARHRRAPGAPLCPPTILHAAGQ